MSLTSLLCAALVGSVTGQGTVVGIEQQRIPFRNGRNRATFRSQIGDLRHIQTLQLERSAGDGFNFTSIIVAEDGSELLAASSDQGGRFVTLGIQPTRRGRYNIGTVTEYPLLDSDGKEFKIPRKRGFRNRMSLAVNGTYRSGGRGDLTIAYEGNPSFVLEKRASRFRRGVGSRSTPLDVSTIQNICDAVVEPGVTIARLAENGDLLFTCLLTDLFLGDVSEPPEQIPLPMGIYTGYTVHDFRVEVTSGYDPIAMAPLKNGDIMIAFVAYTNPRKLRISYLTSEQLQEGIDDYFKILRPVVIADIDQADGYEIGHQSGIAVREDRGRTFVYSMSDDSFAPGKTLLTTFEWRPTRNR